MKVKRVYISPYCWLTFRVRVPYEYLEKLRLLCNIYRYRNIEKLITNQINILVESNQDIIEEQRIKEAEEQRRADEYWKWERGEK